MRNNFDKSIFFFWMDNTECWWCEQDAAQEDTRMPGERVDALHHILGRKSNSIFNSAPVHNFACHLDNGLLTKPDQIRRFLRKTYEYVTTTGYKLKKKDLEFLEEHKALYEKRAQT